MFTPHQSQFTVFGGAFVSENHEAGGRGDAHKTSFSWLAWTVALVVLVAAVAIMTALAHSGSLTMEPMSGDSFNIADPFRM
jgi:hypothetical protein